MFIISKPKVYEKDGETYYAAHISDDVYKLDTDIWYKTPNEYGKYFCHEVADSFVVASLLPAIFTHQDIKVNAPMSEKLYYNITSSLVDILRIAWGNLDKGLNDDVMLGGWGNLLICNNLQSFNYAPESVGCGCSMGVDSLSAILRHTDSNCPNGYKITTLTNFNVGAYGDSFEAAHKSFENDLVLVRQFAEEMKMPVITVESNIGLLFRDFNFDQCGPIRTMSTALSMQKLFKKYYYAPGTSNSVFEIVGHTMCHYAQLLVPLLSTESTELIVADSDKKRIEKTEYIVDNPLTKRFLHVCLREILANDYNMSNLRDSKKLNCSQCYKCQRTLMALEIMGKIKEYGEIFDLDIWNRDRVRYIAKIIAKKKNDVYKMELWNLMRERNYRIPFKSKLLAYGWTCKQFFRFK